MSPEDIEEAFRGKEH